MWGAIIGAVVGGIQGDQEYKAQMKSQLQSYSAIINNFDASKDSIRFMEWFNEKNARESQVEVLRAGASAMREAKVQFKGAEGQLMAQSEGITAGASKARQLSNLYLMESKALGQMDEQTRGQIVGIEMGLEKTITQLESSLVDSYNNAILSIATNTLNINPSHVLQSALAGAQTGQAIGSQLGDIFATNTPTTTTTG